MSTALYHPAPPVPQPTARTILVVEDEPDIARLVDLALTHAGWRVLRAASSAEGVARATELAVDVILLDNRLPDRDGVETVALLRAVPHAAHTPIIFLTASTQSRDVAAYVDAGGVGVIAKPFDALRLSEQIDRLLSASSPPGRASSKPPGAGTNGNAKTSTSTSTSTSTNASTSTRASADAVAAHAPAGTVRWRPAPAPPDELERLRAVENTALLDTPAEPAFDDIARVAAALTGAPIALVTLLDSRRLWFKAHVGLSATQVPRETAVCGYTILQRTPLVVPDATLDPRFADNALVTGPPALRFYAGVPLVDPEGHALGTLCVLDRAPRELSAERLEGLSALARQVMREVELRARTRELGRANEALASARRETERTRDQLLDLLDGVDDLVQSMDETGRLVFVNRAWRAALGYGADETAGMDSFAVIAPESRAACEAAFAQARRAGAAAVDATFVARDGRRLVVEGRVTCRHDASASTELGGAARAVVRGVFRDVTEAHRAVAQLRDSESRLRTVLEIMASGVVIFDERGTIHSFNRAACEMTGRAAEDVLGRSVFALLPPGVREERTRLFAAHARGEPGAALPAVNVLPVVRRDGSTFLAELTRSEIPTRDGVRLFVLLVRDVTEREEIDRLKNEVIAVASHELRTPLTAVHGALSLLTDAAASGLTPTGVELVQIAQHNTERLSRLLDTFLDLEKLEAGRIALQVAPLAPGPLVDSALASVHVLADRAGVVLARVVDEHAHVLAERDRVLQVLVNLLSNAIRVSPAESAVEVRVARASDRPGAVRFRVVDHGPGIAPGDTGRLFQKFQQLGPRGPTRGGSGLGLAISKAIVEQHGGQIGVESAPGTGSVFWFELPAASLPEVPHEARSNATTPTGRAPSPETPRERASAARADSIEAAMAELRAEFTQGLPERLRALDEAMARAQDTLAATPDEAAAAVATARNMVHRLRGTAPTYGFAELGAYAKRVEDALRAGAVIDDATWTQWRAELAAFARAPTT